MNETLQVKIDSREQDRIKSATEYYKSQGLKVEIAELPIGDYIFTDGTEEVVFEFKTVEDFVSSIQNGKIFNQAINQAENYNYHFVMIYGDDHSRAKALAMSKHYQPVTYYGYLGAIASLNRYTTVIESYSPAINEAYYRMLINAKKSLQNKPIVKKFEKKHKNNAFNFLCYAIYGINYKKAKAIIDTYDLKNLSDLQNLTIEKLVKVDGIGEKNAIKIMEAIK